MLEVRQGRAFRKQFKKLLHSGRFNPQVFREIVDVLVRGEILASKYRDHQLSGALTAFRECHLRPDLLLIYEINKKEVTLVLFAIGSHAELFE